ncbi:unnamed protein product [Schistosoma curassoni]|uniref:Reverse transcriptase domain-containing protein n=1 Tax=Schistosoma curassoni TaxID=6186 RepID=A0A183K138_9TREM|nr:unnamed protein product [Schistosoma curassoni]
MLHHLGDTSRSSLHSSSYRTLDIRVGGPSLLVQENPSILATDGAKRAEALSEYFSKMFSVSNEKRPTINFDCGGLLIDPVVIEKGTVPRLLQHPKSDKSNGRDDIHYIIMKAPPDVLAQPIAIPFDMSLRPSRLSRDRKDAIISLVYAAGIRDLVSIYRPLSLTNVFEKLMTATNYVEGHNLLFREQYSFRKDPSCLNDPPITIDWAMTKDRNIPVDVVFIDLSKVFDQVAHSGLKLNVESFGIDYKVIDRITTHSIYLSITRSDQSVSGRSRSHSTGSVSRPFGVVCDQESNPTHYRVAAKPCLVLRSSSSTGPIPTSTSNLKSIDPGSFQRTLCEVSSYYEPNVACTSDAITSGVNKNISFKSKPSSFSSPPSIAQASSSTSLGARRRHSHIEFLDKHGSQSRSPPPSVDAIKAINNVSPFVKVYIARIILAVYFQ